MKKLLYFSFVLAAGLTACNDDYVDQFDIEYRPTDVKNMNFALEEADYGIIANLPANKQIALSKDPEGQTFVNALKDVAKNKYFTESAPAEEYIPALIAKRYPAASLGSRYVVTYNVYQAPSAYLEDLNDLKEYTLTDADYKAVWGNYTKALFLSPKSVSKIPGLLKENIHGAAEGAVAVVNYAYSETEPSTGQEAPIVYKQVNTFDNEAGNYVIVAKGADGQYYPFGKLQEQSFNYGYMKPSPIKVEKGLISGDTGADHVVAIEKSSKGYALKNGWDQYIFMSGSYDSFNVKTSKPSDGADWTITANGDGTFSIKNVSKGKTIKLNYFVNKEGVGSYSFGSYADSKFASATYYRGIDKETKGGNFAAIDVTQPAEKVNVWKFEDGKYGLYWKASGHVGGREGTDEISEGWLVSESIDLTKAKKPQLSLDMVLNFLKGQKRSDYVNIMVSDNYAGDVKTANWTELKIANWPKGDGYDHFKMKGIDLSAYNGKKINIAFKYTSTKKAAPTWQVAEVMVNEPVNYYDVCLFKQMTEDEANEAKVMSRGMSRAAEVAANTSVLYTLTKDGWTPYKAKGANVVVLPQAAYEAAGSATIADAANMLPPYLNVNYPIAKDGDKMAVVYNKSKDKKTVMEFTRTAGAWAKTGKSYAQTTTFVMEKEGISANMSIFLDCPFADGAGDGGFTAVNLKVTGGITSVWNLDSRYGWKASGFNGAEKKPTDSEAWLVSPTMNFKKATAPQFICEIAMNFINEFKPSDVVNLYVSKNYTGDVTACEWELLPLEPQVEGGYGSSWNYEVSKMVDLSNYKGETNVVVAFCYKSNTSVAPTFEMKNLKVAELTEFEK